jgi:hypothetical protein
MLRSALLLLLPSVALGLALALTGCGGSDTGSDDKASATETAISETDFVERANAICLDASEELQAQADELDESSDLEAFITDTAVPSFQSQHDDIAALGAPEGQEDLVQTMLDALQEGIDAIVADPNAAADTESSPFADANAAATELGLTDCDGE